MQIAGHLTESIPFWVGNCHLIIASTGDSPPIGRTLEAEERLEGVARGAEREPGELFLLLQEEMEAAISAIQQMSEAERQKKGVHFRRGEMTVAQVIEVFILCHVAEHLQQIQVALKN